MRRLGGALAVMLLVASALAIRGYFVAGGANLVGDAGGRYLPAALRILEGTAQESVSSPEDIEHNPLYPYILAAGIRTFGGHLEAIIGLNVLLELATLLLIALTAKEVLGSSIGVWVSISIGLLCPFLPSFVPRPMTEIPATFLATLVLYLLSRQGGSLTRSLIIGALAGLGLLLRADLLPAMMLMMLAAWVSRRLVGSREPRAMLRLLVVPALVTWLPLAPVTLMNYFRLGEFRPLGPASSYLSNSYVRWLSTWLDDPRFIAPAYWHVLRPQVDHPFVGSDLRPAEAAEAERALQEARRVGVQSDGRACEPGEPCFLRAIGGSTSPAFELLRSRAIDDRPFDTIILTPMRRAIMTWFRLPNSFSAIWMPSYFSTRELRIVCDLLWFSFLGTSVAGIYLALTRRRWILLPALGLLLGRTAFPVLTAVGAEPRFIVEALPACFLFSALVANEVVSTLCTGARASLQESERSPPATLDTPDRPPR